MLDAISSCMFRTSVLYMLNMTNSCVFCSCVLYKSDVTCSYVLYTCILYIMLDATSYVGALTARTLARYSVSLSLCGVDEKALSNLAADCRSVGLAENRVS